MPDEQAADAAKLVREMTHDLRTGREFLVTPQRQELVTAVYELSKALNATEDAAAAVPQTDDNRTQRRAAKRRH